MPRPAKIAKPPIPTTTPMTVFLVLVDMPLEVEAVDESCRAPVVVDTLAEDVVV